ncbi:TraR/DksA C4-type zinc finger protein [Myxococcus sp. CA033]|uniref:TraR/DksA C4-type zinc finger protein n=1 Tax=Myxococcus sp. CA033 TaxID=2741516 RepID=UPI00157B5C02|nr:TraR/DksA C4-type zinc finger protein [Myxococcus sp. CA033]NTX33810.1 TraR/DksA C4-type zinc finger protein [Myxococcus sp. CA033]
MATPKRPGFWRYKLGLGGDCQVCGTRLREEPEVTNGERLCLDCARRTLGSKSLPDLASEAALGLMVRGLLFMAVGSVLPMILLSMVLIVLVLGGIGFLLYLGVKHAHLPLPLAVMLGSVVLLTAWFLLSSRSRSR